MPPLTFAGATADAAAHASRRRAAHAGDVPRRALAGAARAALASIPEQIGQGFTSVCLKPSQFLDHPREHGAWCRDVVRRVTTLAGVTPAVSTATR